MSTGSYGYVNEDDFQILYEDDDGQCYTEKFWKALRHYTKNSENMTKTQLIEDWDYLRHDKNEINDQCICTHEIKENCIIRNKRYPEQTLVVGNVCVQKWLPHVYKEWKESLKKKCDICKNPHRNRKDNLCSECRKLPKCLLCSNHFKDVCIPCQPFFEEEKHRREQRKKELDEIYRKKLAKDAQKLHYSSNEFIYPFMEQFIEELPSCICKDLRVLIYEYIPEREILNLMGEQILCCGKHKNDTFVEVAHDNGYCDWIKELNPRPEGSLGKFLDYLEKLIKYHGSNPFESNDDRITFGKYEGEYFYDMRTKNPDYCRWVLSLKYISKGMRSFQDYLKYNF